jgi:hypothetical protein
MKFHITITDKETGKAIYDEDTNAVIGGCKTEGGSQSIVVAACGDFDLSIAVGAAENAARTIKKQKGRTFTIMTDMLPELLKAAREEVVESEEDMHEEKNEEDANE